MGKFIFLLKSNMQYPTYGNRCEKTKSIIIIIYYSYIRSNESNKSNPIADDGTLYIYYIFTQIIHRVLYAVI